MNNQFQPTLQKLPPTDTRKKKKHRKKKRGNTQVSGENSHRIAQEENQMYHDLSSQQLTNAASKNLGTSKLPSMGMSVIRQQSQQPNSVSNQKQHPTLPTSTKSEKKLFVNTARHDHRRRRRHRSSEDEPHETTPSISPSSSTGKVYDQEYRDNDCLDDNLSETFQGKDIMVIVIAIKRLSFTKIIDLSSTVFSIFI